jgi:hypothetical protein
MQYPPRNATVAASGSKIINPLHEIKKKNITFTLNFSFHRNNRIIAYLVVEATRPEPVNKKKTK